MLSVRSDLAAQTGDVDVDGAVEDDDLVAPDAVENLLAGEDHAAVGEEQGEDLELLLGEGEFRAVEGADLAPEVHFEPFESDGFGFGAGGCGAAQDAAHAGEDFADGEGFGDVVVGAEVQSGDGIVFGVAGRAEDHGDTGRFGILLEDAGHAEAAHFAHHDIEQDERIAFRVHSEGLFGAVGDLDVITFDFEVELEDFAQRLFIVDHEDFVFCHSFGV